LTGYSYDNAGQPRSFLSTEENYRYVKMLHDRNLIVPITGDFGGEKALRALGAYLKAHDAVVRAFYVSNVEEYLRQDQTWQAFCANVATLPLADGSSFIRAVRNTEPGSPVEGFVMKLDAIRSEAGQCAAASR